MNKFSKAVISLICVLGMSVSLAGCGSSEVSLPGSGTPGVIDKTEWKEYDDLLVLASLEEDPVSRALLLHKAEEMLMDTGCVIPLFWSCGYYLQKDYISNIIPVTGSNLDMSHVRTERPGPGNSVAAYILSEFPKADPSADTSADMATLLLNNYAKLLKKDENGEIVPDLAESYTISDDRMTYTFTMRDNLKWSDGTPLDARDFEYSWKRGAASANGFENGSLFDVISGYPDDLDVKASEDGKTLTVKLAAPCPYFPQLCITAPYVPLQKRQIENAEGYRNASGKVVNPSAWAADAPIVSCGAYVLETWVHNSRMTLKKNPYYYDADNVSVDTIDLMINSDATSLYAAYTAGDISILERSIPADIFPTLKGSPELHITESNTSASIIFNENADIFKGMTQQEAATFRKALGQVIDRQFIVDVVISSPAKPATSYVPESISAGAGYKFYETPGYTYPKDGGYYSIVPDIDGARKMLESIGYKFGKNGKLLNPISIEYKYNPAGTNEAIAVAVQADLAQLGINFIPTAREWAVFLGEVGKRDFECARDAWTADYNDPNTFLSNFESAAPNNKAGLGVPAVK